MPPRRKVIASVEAPADVETLAGTHEQEAATPVAAKVNVKNLIPLVWKSNLEDMQEAVAGIEGDALTMNAVEGIMKAPNSGIAAQFLQQIIQRNS